MNIIPLSYNNTNTWNISMYIPRKSTLNGSMSVYRVYDISIYRYMHVHQMIECYFFIIAFMVEKLPYLLHNQCIMHELIL